MTGDGRRSPAALLPYVLILALTFFLASVPYWVSLPIPAGAIPLRQASFQLEGAEPVSVSLPHRWSRAQGIGHARAIYRLDVDLPASTPMALLIPGAQHALSIQLNGLRILGSKNQPWGEPVAGSAYMVPLPQTNGGTSLLELTLERAGTSVPGFLSEIYLVDDAAAASVEWIWTLASGGTWTTIIGLQALIVLGITIVWLARRRDPIFAWLFLISGSSLAYALSELAIGPVVSANGQPYGVFIMSSYGLMAVGLALSIMGKPRPVGLKIAMVALPVFLIAGTAVGLFPPIVSAAISSLFGIGGHVVAAAMLFANALRFGEWDRALLAVPFFLTGWYGLRDLGILTGVVDHVLMLSSRTRPVTIIAVLTLLMRRLASSLDQIDCVNETLRQRLAEQEKELSLLHLKDRTRLAQATREDERGRLMRDLHDGLSGQLVSIIALSQAKNANPPAIERAARSALDDLRLVINSLDLDDGDLMLALAGLRERLEPQLRRSGTDLDWSMENLPQVTGVTPNNALSILRILQEAITNAIKHGTQDCVSVRGSRRDDGAAIIVVENKLPDAFVRGKGRGQQNMERRASEVGGNVAFDLSDNRARLALLLPPKLLEHRAEGSEDHTTVAFHPNQ